MYKPGLEFTSLTPHRYVYNRAPVIVRHDTNERIEFVALLLISFAIGCALVSIAG